MEKMTRSYDAPGAKFAQLELASGEYTPAMHAEALVLGITRDDDVPFITLALVVGEGAVYVSLTAETARLEAENMLRAAEALEKAE